eukprot:g2489.t1
MMHGWIDGFAPVIDTIVRTYKDVSDTLFGECTKKRKREGGEEEDDDDAGRAGNPTMIESFPASKKDMEEKDDKEDYGGGDDGDGPCTVYSSRKRRKLVFEESKDMEENEDARFATRDVQREYARRRNVEGPNPFDTRPGEYASRRDIEGPNPFDARSREFVSDRVSPTRPVYDVYHHHHHYHYRSPYIYPSFIYNAPPLPTPFTETDNREPVDLYQVRAGSALATASSPYYGKYEREYKRSSQKRRRKIPVDDECFSSLSRADRMLERDHLNRQRYGWNLHEERVNERAKLVRSIGRKMDMAVNGLSTFEFDRDATSFPRQESSFLRPSWSSTRPAPSPIVASRVMRRDRSVHAVHAPTDASRLRQIKKKDESEDNYDDDGELDFLERLQNSVQSFRDAIGENAGMCAENGKDDETEANETPKKKDKIQVIELSSSENEEEEEEAKREIEASTNKIESQDIECIELSSSDEDEEEEEESGSEGEVASSGGEEDADFDESTQEFVDVLPKNRFSERDLMRMMDALNTNKSMAAYLGQVDADYVTRRKIQCLRHGTWINDEVFNFFMADLSDRTPDVLCFSSFFFAKLTENRYTYANVRRWTRKIDVTALKKIVVPIHLPKHWAVAVIDIQRKQFLYYDSLDEDCANGPAVYRTLRRYWIDEAKDKRNETDANLHDWKDVRTQNVPQQQNFIDCGVFAMKFAECACGDIPVATFDQADIPTVRAEVLLRVLDSQSA